MRRLGILLALTLCVVLGSCTDDADDPASAPAPFDLPVGDPSYDVDAPSWAVGTSIHVGDVEITADPAPEIYVVTRSGIYYVAKSNALYFTDGGPAELVTDLAASSLAVSPDHERLALIDRAHGEPDTITSNVAVPVVFDVDTGEQIFRGTPGGDPEDEDLGALYQDIEPVIIGVDDQAVYAVDPLQNPNETLFPLDGSPPEPIKGNPMIQRENGIEGFAIKRPKGRLEWSPTLPNEIGSVTYSAVLSPAEDVFFTVPGKADRYYDIETGRPTIFSETPFSLGGWVDDDTFYGAFSTRGSGEGPEGRTVIATCEVAEPPTCTRVSREFRLPSEPVIVFGTGSRFLF